MIQENGWLQKLDTAVTSLPISLRSPNGSLATVELLKSVFTEDDFEADILSQPFTTISLKNQLQEDKNWDSPETLESLEQKLLLQGDDSSSHDHQPNSGPYDEIDCVTFIPKQMARHLRLLKCHDCGKPVREDRFKQHLELCRSAQSIRMKSQGANTNAGSPLIFEPSTTTKGPMKRRRLNGPLFKKGELRRKQNDSQEELLEETGQFGRKNTVHLDQTNVKPEDSTPSHQIDDDGISEQTIQQKFHLPNRNKTLPLGKKVSSKPETPIKFEEDGSKSSATTPIEPTSMAIDTKIPSQLPVSQPKRKRRGKAGILYNPEIHCGVLNSSGFPCMRALTCKAHTMYAKRLVSGRTQPFDTLVLVQRLGKRSEGASSLSFSDAHDKNTAETFDSSTSLQIGEEIEAIFLAVQSSRGYPLALRKSQFSRDIHDQDALRETLKEVISFRPSRPGVKKLSTGSLITPPPVRLSPSSLHSSLRATQRPSALSKPLMVGGNNEGPKPMVPYPHIIKKSPKALTITPSIESSTKKIVSRKGAQQPLPSIRPSMKPVPKMYTSNLDPSLNSTTSGSFSKTLPDRAMYLASTSIPVSSSSFMHAYENDTKILPPQHLIPSERSIVKKHRPSTAGNRMRSLSPAPLSHSSTLASSHRDAASTVQYYESKERSHARNSLTPYSRPHPNTKISYTRPTAPPSIYRAHVPYPQSRRPVIMAPSSMNPSHSIESVSTTRFPFPRTDMVKENSLSSASLRNQRVRTGMTVSSSLGLSQSQLSQPSASTIAFQEPPRSIPHPKSSIPRSSPSARSSSGSANVFSLMNLNLDDEMGLLDDFHASLQGGTNP